MDIPAVDFTTDGLYEVTLVATGLFGALLVMFCLKHAQPWWEAKKMHIEQERKENKAAAHYLWWAMKQAVQDGQVSADHGGDLVKRIGNILPDILPGREWGHKSVKEILQEKHPNGPPAYVATEEVKPPVRVSLLARLSAAKRKPQIS